MAASLKDGFYWIAWASRLLWTTLERVTLVLAYLWKYGFDKLKIDRSFLLGYDQDPKKLEKIIGSVVNLGHCIDMDVTIEGVETDEHVSILKDMKCDQLQGYYFGKPMPIAKAESMINAA